MRNLYFLRTDDGVYPYFIEILKEGYPHIFFEKTAEIFLTQPQMTGNVLERDGLAEMIFYISDDVPDAVKGHTVGCGCVSGRLYGEGPDEAGQYLHNQAFRFHKIRRCIAQIEAGNIFHQLTDKEIFRELFIRDLVGNTFNPIQVDIRPDDDKRKRKCLQSVPYDEIEIRGTHRWKNRRI
nr:hypothetical protein [Ruminococcus turbiniformis]